MPSFIYRHIQVMTVLLPTGLKFFKPDLARSNEKATFQNDLKGHLNEYQAPWQFPAIRRTPMRVSTVIIILDPSRLEIGRKP